MSNVTKSRRVEIFHFDGIFMIHDDNNILGILHQNNVESLHIQKLLQLTKERS